MKQGAAVIDMSRTEARIIENQIIHSNHIFNRVVTTNGPLMISVFEAEGKAIKITVIISSTISEGKGTVIIDEVDNETVRNNDC